MSSREKNSNKKDIKKFDFLDFGASKSASIDFGRERLFGKRGLGIDLDAKRVDIMNKSGYDCMVGDLTDLDLPDKCVKFVKMSHILEHMPDLAGVEKALISAKKTATDFLVITGPFFDEDEYLKSLGFKLDWSDYPEHTCHLTIDQLVKILNKLKLEDYELYVRNKIIDSNSVRIHPLDSPPGSHDYNPNKHSPKKRRSFNRDIWTDFVCYVRLGDVNNWKEVTRAYNNQIPFMVKEAGVLYSVPALAVEKFNELDVYSQNQTKLIKELKTKKADLSRKVSDLQSQLSSLRASRSFKTANKISRASSLVRPTKLRQKIRSKL